MQVRNIFRFLGIAIGSLVFAGLITALSLPFLLSTKRGQEFFTSIINDKITGKVALKDLNLSWFQGQTINGLKVYDSDGKEIVTLDHATTDSSLFRLLMKKLSGKTTFEGLNANINQDGLGTTNLQKALSFKDHSLVTPAKANKYLSTIVLSNLNGTIDLGKASQLQLSGNTAQNGTKGAFDFNAFLEGIGHDQLASMTSNQLLAEGHLKIKGEATQFPVGVLDLVIGAKKPQLAGLARSLLGDTIDLSINQTLKEGAAAFIFKAKSPTLDADLVGTIDKGEFKLTQPGTVSLGFTPASFAQLTEVLGLKQGVQLIKPTIIRLTVQDAAIPLDQKEFQKAGLIAQVEIPDAQFKVFEPIGDVSLSTLKLSIDAPTQSKTVTLSVKGAASQKGKPVGIQAYVTIDRPQSLQEAIKMIKQNAKINISLNGIPIPLIDQVLNVKQSLTQALGETLNLQAAIEPRLNQTKVTAQISSEKLKASDLNFTMNNDELSLVQGVRIDYMLTSAMANALLKDAGMQLQTDTPLSIKISRLNLPLNNFALSSIVLEADASAPVLLLQGNQKIGAVSINNLKVILNGKSIADAQYFVTADADHPSLKDMIGTNTAISLDGNIKLGDRSNSYAIDIRGNLKSALSQAKFSLQLLDGAYLLVTAPSVINYTLTSATLPGTALAENAPVQITINPSQKPMGFEGLQTLNLSGTLKIDQLKLANQAYVKNLNLPWHFDGHANQLQASFSGITGYGKNTGELAGSFSVANWIENKEKIQVNAQSKIKHLPLSILESLTGYKNLVTLFGDTADLDLNASYPQGALDFALRGDKLDAKANLKFGDLITLQDPKNPAIVHYTITPERFTALRQLMGIDTHKEGFILNEASPMQIAFEHLSIPIDYDLSKLGFSSQMSIGKIKINDTKTHQMLAFDNINGALKTNGLSNQLGFNLIGNQTFATTGAFNLAGVIQNALHNKGGINWDMDLNLTGKIATFPAGLVCSVVCLDPTLRAKIDAMFGETIDAELQVQLQKMDGPVLAKLEGKNGSIQVDGKLNDGVLTLNKAFQAQFAMTPEFGKNVVEEFIPLLSGIIGADNPLSITVQPQGFSAPLRNFDKSKIQIGQGTINLGHIRFRNDGQLGAVSSLLNTNGMEDLSVWFTPLYFNMQNGTLKMARMDMLLLNSYHVATWGKVNLAQDNVNIMIGLTGDALTKAFHLKGLDDDYMMQIPFKGPLNKASIDKRAATAKISALIASTRGPKGQLVGAFLDIAGGALTDGDVPVPTTNPLPWKQEKGNITEAKKEKQSVKSLLEGLIR